MSDKNIKFIFFIIALLILGFFFSSELVPIKNFFYQLTNPLSRVITDSSGKVKKFFADIRSIGDLTKENVQLEQENQQLKSKLAQLKEVEHENEILKTELGFSQEQKEYQLIPSEIIARSPTSFLQTLKIDKGSNDGVEKDKAVLSGGFLIGSIQEVGADYSEVFLITNAHSLIAAVLQESRGTGLLRGGLKGLTIEDVPLDTEIKAEELVVTSGLGGDLPAGLPIGTIDKIISSESEIFQRASVKSPVEFAKLEIVFVIK